ncbi:phosphopantetheine-binding protein [Streptosporangium sp. NPDC004379]|uniref:phosphopantetheine-binding protein n=1 Tax=Streptosporangium sp. NPDC004379 TaxID=3366189 RepID=UPI003693BAD0
MIQGSLPVGPGDQHDGGARSVADVRGRPGRPVPIADRVTEMIESRLGRPLDPDENFFEAGLNSMALVELHADITGTFDIDIPVTAMFTRPNAKALGRLVESARADAPAPGSPASGTPAGGVPASGSPAPGSSAPGSPTSGSPAGGAPVGGAPAQAGDDSSRPRPSGGGRRDVRARIRRGPGASR